MASTNEVTAGRSVAVAALRWSTGVLAALGAAMALRESAWLGGGRAWAMVPVAAVVALGLRRPAPRLGGLLAVGGATAGAVLVLSRLGRREGTFADRVLARDVPPPGVWALAALTVLVLAGCAAVAVLDRGRRREEGRRPNEGQRRRDGGQRQHRPPPTGRERWRALAASALVIVIAVASVALAGRAGYGAADDRAAESGGTYTLVRRAERGSDAPQPEEAGRMAWRTGPLATSSIDQDAASPAAVAVPGWDAVLTVDSLGAHSDVPVLAAISTQGGAELWRYGYGVNDTRHVGGVADQAGIVVDPDAGRVLMVGDDAYAVLALEDGAEVAAGRLPGGLECRPRSLVTDRFFLTDPIVVGPVAVLRCAREAGPQGVRPFTDGRLVAIETASGRVLADVENLGCDHAAVAAGATVFVVRWGIWDECGPPVLSRLGPDGQIEDVAEIRNPPGTKPTACFCGDSTFNEQSDGRLMVADDTVVLSLPWDPAGRPAPRPEWSPEDPRAMHELVALSAHGDELWRLTSDSPWPTAANGAVAALVDGGVVARWADGWRVLGLRDGRTLASEPAVPDEATESGYGSWTAGGAHVYSVADDGTVVVRRAQDLSIVATTPGAAGDPMIPRRPAIGDGLLLAMVGDYTSLGPARLVAYRD